MNVSVIDEFTPSWARGIGGAFPQIVTQSIRLVNLLQCCLAKNLPVWRWIQLCWSSQRLGVTFTECFKLFQRLIELAVTHLRIFHIVNLDNLDWVKEASEEWVPTSAGSISSAEFESHGYVASLLESRRHQVRSLFPIYPQLNGKGATRCSAIDFTALHATVKRQRFKWDRLMAGLQHLLGLFQE